MCVNGQRGGAVGNNVCGLWERQRLFHRAVNAFSIGKAAIFHISIARA